LINMRTGQKEEIDRVCHAYPQLKDDGFVQEHWDGWLSKSSDRCRRKLELDVR